MAQFQFNLQVTVTADSESTADGLAQEIRQYVDYLTNVAETGFNGEIVKISEDDEGMPPEERQYIPPRAVPADEVLQRLPRAPRRRR